MGNTTMKVFLVALVTAAHSAHLRKVVVPTVALAGTDVPLQCDYDETGSKLYSLKWYKDGQEMYRHVPASPKQPDCAVAVANLPGVTVDCWASTEREVVLRGVSQATSGHYRCEIIGDHPDFRKEEKDGVLIVVREPVLKPEIHGALSTYRRFDEVSLNCSSTNTEYDPKLTWLLNGRPATLGEVIPFDNRTLGVRIRALSEHFSDGSMEVSCVASKGPLKRSTTSLRLSAPYLKPQHYFSLGVGVNPCPLVLLLPLLLLLPFQ